MHRLALVGESVHVEPVELLSDPREWISMVSSRLGHDLSHHRHVSRFLSRAMLDCNRRSGVALIAMGSAIEPLASRAAELFRVPVLRIGIATDKLKNRDVPELLIHDREDRKLDRDQLAIMLADRVDVLHARRGGKMAMYAEKRITQLHDTSTRVAISTVEDDVAKGLIASGGIGWHLRPSHMRPSHMRPPENVVDGSIASNQGTSSSDRSQLGAGEWLVHCTRGSNEPWPDETANQFRDSVLLNETDGHVRGAFQTLSRIVRGGKLVASCRASDRRFSVVCFSAVPLAELLERRQYRSHLHRWDYEPYGIALRTTAAERLGIRPVVYGELDERSHLPADDQYLFQAKGKTFDWTSEREWRSRGDIDLCQLSVDDVRIFTQSEEQAVILRRICAWRVDAVGACCK